MRRLYGFKSLFITSDDHQVLVDATTRYANWKVYSRQLLHAHAPTSTETPILVDRLVSKTAQGLPLDLFSAAVETALDVLFLSQADGFLGKFTSNIDRIVLQLMAGRDGCLPPYASLDAPWCDPFTGQGKSKFGHFTCLSRQSW
mmetsp:Transcript_22831/g.66453  ORF Transcript_22831/g.66453 Transcript_22831/m.66453 type:complete len:144 (-) Transcript_22831:69-500(-)